MVTSANDPHASQPVRTAGPAPESAAATLIMVHGRGAAAESILELHSELAIPNLAALAPQAAGRTWYPHSFLAPIPANQPYLDSALARIESLVADLLSRGIPSNRIALLGFSQGACLSTEFAARHPRRYGAILALTGGLIGPNTPRQYPGTLEGTPVLLASGDPDPHVPFNRVEETRAVLAAMGAHVDMRRYPGLPHTVNVEELDLCRKILSTITPNTR
jgi:predicted esterase